FTTQTATRELTALRAGLYGSGPFGRLTDCFPAGLISNAEPGVQVLRDEALRTALDALFPTAPPADFDAVSHLVLGTIEVPYLLADDDGHGPVVPDAAVVGASCDPAEANDWLRVLPVEGDDDEHFRLDSETGALTAIRAEVPFWCAVPKNGQPAPVVLYGHDVGGSRLDGLRLAGAWARWGLATCAIDAVGHGPVLSAETTAALAALDERGRVFELGRARDLNGDGVLDPGVDTFTPDPLHTRDVIRQSALDWVAFLRVLRSFDGRRRWRSRPVGVSSNLAGDFDDDGRVDFGGPDLPVHVTGEGYGGMLAGIVAAIEPRVTSAAPVSAAGGLVDVSLRSARPGVPQTALLPSFGPLIIGLPDVDRRGQTGTGGVLVTAWVNDLARPAHADPQARVGLPLAKIATLDPGDLVVLTNLNTGERREARVNAAGGFQVAVGAEALMGSARLHRLRYGPQVDVTELGDLLRLEVYTDPKVTLETFRYTVNFQEAVYPNQP
ncbi:MAG: hypothetical protein KC620_25635, partial [Myxococcales bacterium]|nr:hypothetical protein [Myxococcales bacterium]